MSVRRGRSRAAHRGALRAKVVGQAGEPTIYGPTLPVGASMATRVQKVRDDSGPRAVTDPGPGVGAASVHGDHWDADPYYYFNNATNYQAMVRAHAANKTFIALGSQTYNRTSNILTDAFGPFTDCAKNPTIVFLPGALIRGHTSYGPTNTRVATGGEQNAVRFTGAKAFTGTIRGGIWEFFNIGPQVGTDGLLEDAEVRWCWSVGVTVSGDRPKVRYCWLHHNGVNGITGNANGETCLKTHTGFTDAELAADPFNESLWTHDKISGHQHAHISHIYSDSEIINGVVTTVIDSPIGVWGYDAELSYCEVSENNQRGLLLATDPGFNSYLNESTMKFVFRANDWVHHNWFHNNAGWGIWWDVYNRGDPSLGRGYTLVEENVVEDQWLDPAPAGLAGSGGTGIYLEIGWGPVVVRHNYCANNWGGQITTRSQNAPTQWVNIGLGNAKGTGVAAAATRLSGLVEIHNNYMWSWTQGTGFGNAYGCFKIGDEAQDFYSHDNFVSSARKNTPRPFHFASGDQTSYGRNPGGDPFFWIAPERNIRFERNHWQIVNQPTVLKPFQWGREDGANDPSGNLGQKTWDEWQALGFDVEGTFEYVTI